jgi:hypothetical protein
MRLAAPRNGADFLSIYQYGFMIPVDNHGLPL